MSHLVVSEVSSNPFIIGFFTCEWFWNKKYLGLYIWCQLVGWILAKDHFVSVELQCYSGAYVEFQGSGSFHSAHVTLEKEKKKELSLSLG